MKTRTTLLIVAAVVFATALLSPHTAHAQAQCSDELLELHYAPDKLELRNADEPFCIRIPQNNRPVDALIPILLYPDFPFTPNSSTFRVRSTPGLKYESDGSVATCSSGFRVGVQLRNRRLMVVWIKKTSASLDEVACFDIIVRGIGRLDPRAKVVRLNQALTPGLESILTELQENALLDIANADHIVTEIYKANKDNLPIGEVPDPGDWYWEDDEEVEGTD
jgi:hypothetical protein